MHIMNLASTIASAAGQVKPAAGDTAIAVDHRGDGDGDRGRTHRGHGGGRLHEALAAALQSLGLTLPKPPTDAAQAAATTPVPASDDAGETQNPAGTIRQDVHDFMHQLFSALRDSVGSSGDSGGRGSLHDKREKFAGALSTLIGQVGSGNAPAGLQSSFDKLVTDLKQAGAVTVQTGDAGSTATQPTLQQLLAALQQQTGYGAAAGGSGVGNTVDTVA